MVNPLIVIPLISSLITAFVISGIWIGPNSKKSSDSSTPTVQTNNGSDPSATPSIVCTQQNSCNYYLVESIPWGIYNDEDGINNYTTSSAWLDLFNRANRSIEIASYYWTLLAEDSNFTSNDSSTNEVLFDDIIPGKRGVTILITQNAAVGGYSETAYLEKNGWAQVRTLNFTNFLESGILHTKTIVVDRQHFYVGSANFDWRSFTQVKELGAAVFNCSCLAADLGKIFDVYWQMGVPNAQLPDKWPDAYSTIFNAQNPMSARLNDENDVVYFSVSPPNFRAGARANDIDAILSVQGDSKNYILKI